jgi:hypothetical protein
VYVITPSTAMAMEAARDLTGALVGTIVYDGLKSNDRRLTEWYPDPRTERAVYFGWLGCADRPWPD